MSLQAHAFTNTCSCKLDFEKKDGSTFSETVDVNCPKADSKRDLKCQGDEFAG